MRRALRVSGNLLIAISLIGIAGLCFVLFSPDDVAPTASVSEAGLALPWAGAAAPSAGIKTSASGAGQVDAAGARSEGVPQSLGVRPITRVVIPSIDLSAEVVPADLVPIERGVTWQVPAFKVGHAAGTAGAGQVGNAVLLGHVTSVHSGNVLQDLHYVEVGDEVQIYSDTETAFTYRVVSSTHVPRTDSDILQPTPSPTVSLITCTGVWLPTIWDYTERLVVRAELSQ